MPATVQYPKRLLHNEAFACQYNVIEKTLTEVKNQPSGYYINNNKRKTHSFKTSAVTSGVTPSPLSLYPDTQANVRDLGSLFPKSGGNSFSMLGIQAPPEPQMETPNKSYFFDPFQPVDLNKESFEANRSVFNSSLNLDYNRYSTRSSAPNIWGDSKIQGLSKNTSVWA